MKKIIFLLTLPLALINVSCAILGHHSANGICTCTCEACRNCLHKLSPEQLARVESSPDPAESFARAWTMVESVLKADGRGFSYPVRGGHLPEGYRTVVHALTGQDGQRHMLSLSVPADVEPRLTLVRLNIADVVNQLERGRRTSL